MKFLLEGFGMIFQDLRTQSIFMKLVIGWGWLAFIIMTLSIIDAFLVSGG